MSNLEDLQQREKSSAIKHQNHLNLFEAQISSLKNTITELKQQNENYHLKSHAAMESAKLINNNYNKDYELFTRRLAQSIATEKDDLSA